MALMVFEKEFKKSTPILENISLKIHEYNSRCPWNIFFINPRLFLGWFLKIHKRNCSSPWEDVFENTRNAYGDPWADVLKIHEMAMTILEQMSQKKSTNKAPPSLKKISLQMHDIRPGGPGKDVLKIHV